MTSLPLPRQVNAAVPPALEAVVMKAMAKNPDDRYRSAEELRADLLRFADGRPVEAGDAAATSMMAAVGTTQLVSGIGPSTGVVPVATPAAGVAATDDDANARKRRTRRLVGLLVVLLVALAVIAYFLFSSLLGGNVTVPDVVGKSAVQATQILQGDNLAVGTTKSVASTTVAKGVVVSTDPKAGTSVSKNASVDLVVSAGPPVDVPSVVGQTFTQATQLLSGAGLGYTVKYVSSNKPVGTVLAQDPAGGQKVVSTTKVQLTVSGTQTSVTVPSVLGQSAAGAGVTLGQAGLTVGNTTSACSGQYAAGLVQSQNPAAGTTISPSRSVDIVTSNCVTVPNVVGQSSAGAQSALGGAGLSASVTTDTSCPNGAAPGTVDNQNPGPNALGVLGHHGEPLGLSAGHDDDHQQLHHNFQLHHHHHLGTLTVRPG